MANPPTEQRELDLVEKVDFRILGVSNNEEKLQQLLKTYLPPLLLKAGSEHASVRNKVCCPNPLPDVAAVSPSQPLELTNISIDHRHMPETEHIH